MLYGSGKETAIFGDLVKPFNLVMTEAENEMMLAGKPVRHLIGSATESGVITVTYKRNSKKRHQVYLGNSS